jgi:DNA polymerase-3 subunit delta'
VPLPPLIGHRALRARLDEQVTRGTLGSSLLLTGPAGIGKQRLALWLAQRLLCTEPGSPCGACQHCSYIIAGGHPDLLWIFPHPRLKDAEPSVEQAAQDNAEAIATRLEGNGLYARPDGSASIYLYVAKYLVQRAVMTPALARRKVFVVGEAERMVPQASSQEAANAFLKLLEEPPADTTLILTSSEPGALLPTIRSRVTAMRVQPLAEAEMREFLALPAAEPFLKGKAVDELVRLARGAPGSLLDADARATAFARARTMLEVASGSADRIFRVAYSHGSTKSRGPFTDMLDALTEVLHAHSRAAAEAGDERQARAGARAVVMVEEAKRDAERNAVPQLIAFRLLSQLTETLA